MTREEIYEFLGWTLKAEPIVGDLSYRIIELVAFAEERTLTNQKARYYQEGYDAGYYDGSHDERDACAKVCDGWTHANGDDCAEAIRARSKR